MTLARTPRQSSSFGRRGAAAVGRPAYRAAPRPLAVPAAQQTAEGRSTIATSPSPGDRLASQASRGKAYVKAVIAGATMFLAVLFMLTGVENRFFQSGPMLAFLAVPILPTLALILYIPTVVLSDIARLLSIPRGWADIGIGLVLGTGLGTGVVVANPPDDGRSLAIVLAMTAGGLAGGFAFWRAQGYPGLASRPARALDEAYDKVR